MRQHLLSQVQQLHGKQLGFNNLYDLHAARCICGEFTLPCAVIVKHNNPCGVRAGREPAAAYEKALGMRPRERLRLRDRRQPPGGRTAGGAPGEAVRRGRCSRPATRRAPGDPRSASPTSASCVNSERRRANPGEFDYKRVLGGVLVQDKDSRGARSATRSPWPSKRHPTEQEWGDLIFAFRVAKHVKSNAIVIAKNLATLGVGAGQMSRVDSTRIAIEKARGDLKGAVVGSDAFFPFPDAVQLAIESGVTAFMQPAAPRATRRPSRSATPTTPPWCSPAGATSCTEACADVPGTEIPTRGAGRQAASPPLASHPFPLRPYPPRPRRPAPVRVRPPASPPERPPSRRPPPRPGA